jgi:hypothetical protein
MTVAARMASARIAAPANVAGRLRPAIPHFEADAAVTDTLAGYPSMLKKAPTFMPAG